MVLPVPAAIDDDIETGPSTADDDNDNDDNNNDGDDDDDDGDDYTQQLWMRMFQKLVEYKKQHINTMVPSCYDENPKLGRWVASQRNIYSKDALNPNRVDLYNSIYFIWEGKMEYLNQIWMGMFVKLVQYKNQHKNTMVPSCYDENPKLERWVASQRNIYSKDELNPNRVDLLNSVRFDWAEEFREGK